MPEHYQVDPASVLGQGLSSPGYITTTSDVEAGICAPPCECDDCQHGFYAVEEQYRPCFWYSDRISDEEAKALVNSYVQRAERDRQYLQQILASHGDLIMSRWKKKSKEKRRALLANTVPELCEQRWIIPRFCYMPESKLVGLGSRTWERRCQLLAHWLSLEVLKSNPAVLFALLLNRSVYPLQDWAAFDARQLILSWACGHFDVKFSAKCVVMHGPNYGKLVDWTAEQAHRADIVGFPKASLILEGQSYLLGVLRKIVDKIIEGVDLSKPASSEKWQQMTKLGFRHANELELWSPYTNQAFSSPPAFSIDNLISIAQTRLAAVGDHLWFLQTDPAYMRRHIKTLCQGEFYRTIKREAAGAVITTDIFQDVLSYWRWGWIRTECEYVKIIYNRFQSSIYPGEALPRLYDRALGSLELLVVNEVIHRARQIEIITPQRPGFSHKWTFKWKPDHGPTVFQLNRKDQTSVEQKALLDKDPLEWCFSQLQGEPDKQTNYDHAILFAFLEDYLTRCTSKEKARVDELLYRKLSDLAACHEILVAVRLHRPQNKARDIDEVEKSEKRIAWRGRKIEGFLTNDDTINLGAALLKDFFNAPLPGGMRDAEWVRRSQSIRKALESFWTGLRKTPKMVLELSEFTVEEVRETLEIISCTLTQGYLDSVEAENQEMRASISDAKAPSSNSVQREWGPSSTSAQVEESGPKAKVKSRPAEQPSQLEDVGLEVASLVIALDEVPPRIQIKKRAFNMISLMFPRTAAESAKGMDWDPFVLAMSDMGFLARNVGGSAVMFEGGNGVEGEASSGKIIFHKPHPVAKLDPVMLHSMGKRMAKWFQWDRDRFVMDCC